MTMHVQIPYTPLGCNCGAPWWSVTPPPPCPYHSTPVEHPPMGPVPYSPIMSPKELAAFYRRLADALDPPFAPPTSPPTT